MPIVMAVPAIIEPCTTLLAPRVAALSRAQTRFFAWAPLVNLILVLAAVTRVGSGRRRLEVSGKCYKPDVRHR